jgi:hypothetical protein
MDPLMAFPSHLMAGDPQRRPELVEERRKEDELDEPSRRH